MESPVTPSSSPPPKPTAPIRLPANVKVALLIFFLVSAVILAVFPVLSRSSATPPFGLFLGVGLIMVVLTSLLFGHLGRLKLGFGRRALVLAAGYSIVIGLIKLGLSPQALYLSNQHQSFSTQYGDPNTPYFYLVAAAVVLVLYVGTFRLIYRHFVERLRRRTELVPADAPRSRRVNRKGVVVLGAGVVGVVALGGGVILLPLFLLAPSLAYVGYVFGALAIPLAVALGLASFLAYRGFAAVEQQVIATGNGTLLASFFWLGVSLIVLYHVLWVVFMLTLVQLWPFNTYTPK